MQNLRIMYNGELEVVKHHNHKHSGAQLCVTKSPSAQLRKVEALGLMHVLVFPQCGAISFVCKFQFLFQRIIFSGTLRMREYNQTRF